MNRTLMLIISIVIVALTLILSEYYSRREQKIEVQQFNLKYEQYSKKEIPGRDIATIINKAVDDNKKNTYLKDDEILVNIEIKITEFKEEQIYDMKTLYNGGMDEFVKYYGDIPFKCADIKYNKNGQVNYMIFEQIMQK